MVKYENVIIFIMFTISDQFYSEIIIKNYKGLIKPFNWLI